MTDRVPFSTVPQAFALAKRRLPPMIYNKMVNQSMDGSDLGIRENERVFDDVLFRPRAAEVHLKRDLGTTILGNAVTLPLGLSSPGGSRIYHPVGEPGVAAAANDAGTVNIMAMSHGHTLEEVASAAPGPLWQQVYMSLGREAVEEAIDRSRAAGIQALVVTVDFLFLPQAQQHETARINTMNLRRYGPEAIRRPRWAWGFLRDQLAMRGVPEAEMRPTAGGGSPARWREGLAAPTNQISPTWEDIAWIKERWGGPLVIKGILSPEDARRSIDVGADAIMVSNHGGLGLASFPSSLRVLPSVVAAVGDDCEVYVDSGIRRGSDVVKAVALGARAAFIGRPYMMGLAVAGQAGVAEIIEIFRREIDLTLANLGCPSIHDLDPSFVDAPSTWR